MVRRIYKNVFFIFLLLNAAILAQPDTFVRVSATTRNVKVKQPFELRISVYTQTWFTSAPNLDNIVIPGALVIKKDRAQSKYETINNTRYTILYFDFIVFPVKEGELLIPEITLNYATPEPGYFKGKDVERKTKPIKVRVDSLEKGFSLSDWLVATHFNATESWNKDLKKVKVGDVVERTLVIRTSGTLAALIPSSDSLSVSWGKVYYSTPALKNEIVEGIIHSERTEKITILLEKPGEYIIPEQTYSWWNPNTNKISTNTLSEKKIIIEDNPDLAILKSIQDSLDVMNKTDQVESVEDKPFTIFGLLIWQFIIVSALFLVILNRIWRLVLYLNKKYRERKAAYLQSENFYFDQIETACKQNDLLQIRNRLFKWLTRVNQTATVYSVGEFLNKYGNGQLVELYQVLENKLFGKQKSPKEFPGMLFFKQLQKARQKFLVNEISTSDSLQAKFQLNPK